MKTAVTILFSSVLLLGVGTAARAQNPYARPTVSPYLNLYRGGQPAALNYYNLVRPEIDYGKAIQQLQQQGVTTQQAISDLQTPAGPLVTGHAAGFMTHRTYFQTLGSGTVTAAGFGTAGRPTGGRR